MALPTSEHAIPIKSAGCGCSGSCSTTLPLSVPPVASGQAGATMLRIPAMDCPSEENDIRRALADIDGIRSLSFQLSARTLSIDAPDSVLPAAVAAIRQAGYEAKILAAGSEASEGSSVKADLWKAVLALALATGAELVHFIAPDTLPFRVLGMAVAAIAIGLAGLSTYTKGLAALRRGQLNMNALMGVAVTGAFLIGQWPEAAMVMALYAIAELIEARSVDRARNAIKSLLDLTPDTAEVQQADGVWREVPAGQVTLDASVRVKPGARIPLDGRVTAGTSAVNQATVTGESMQVDKVEGQMVVA